MTAVPRLIALVTVLSVLLAPAGSAAAAAPMSFRLISFTTSVKATDRAPKGASAGDTVRETSRLLNEVQQFGKPKLAVVGSDAATSTLSRGLKSSTVTGVARLPGGTLLFRGMPQRNQKGGALIPVVGGTGAYVGARGTLWIVNITNPKRTLNIYTLSYGTVA
jgi:hypothetical protein